MYWIIAWLKLKSSSCNIKSLSEFVPILKIVLVIAISLLFWSTKNRVWVGLNGSTCCSETNLIEDSD